MQCSHLQDAFKHLKASTLGSALQDVSASDAFQPRIRTSHEQDVHRLTAQHVTVSQPKNTQ
jgi:hypothetical protein